MARWTMTREEEREALQRLGGLIEAKLERVRTVHERVACPRCRAAVGVPCLDLRVRAYARRAKHPHRERLTADGITLR